MRETSRAAAGPIVAAVLLSLAAPLRALTIADCGRLLDMKAGVWRKDVSVVVDVQGRGLPLADHENTKEFAYLVEAGMPALEGIRTATLNAAQLLDQSARLGSVEAGYAADMVAVDGDPLKDVTRLQSMAFVMKDGVVYKQPK